MNVAPWVIQLVIVAARALGRLRARDFEAVLDWVTAEAGHPVPGETKMAEVLRKWRARFGESRPGHVARTVIEIAYAVLRARHTL